MNILITGSHGFIARNLIHVLQSKELSFLQPLKLYTYDRRDAIEDLKEYLTDCDFIIHLAGVNRPQKAQEYEEGNKGFTQFICDELIQHRNTCPILMTSSIQAVLDNDYGRSKRAAENCLRSLWQKNGNKIYLYRLPNVYGKWCRPDYNSVVATWCYHLARNQDIQIHDEQKEITLCYIDDVITEILNCLQGKATVADESDFYKVEPTTRCRLSELRNILYSFKNEQQNLTLPNQTAFVKKLYATYLSYLPQENLSYSLTMHQDARGSFTEMFHMDTYGQVSVNVLHPGIVKGNHWHMSKNEKYVVVAGEGNVKLRNLYNDDHKLLTYHLSANKMEVVDIPPGYLHCIENTGTQDMVVIIWSNEVFDETYPDTYYKEV